MHRSYSRTIETRSRSCREDCEHIYAVQRWTCIGVRLLCRLATSIRVALPRGCSTWSKRAHHLRHRSCSHRDNDTLCSSARSAHGGDFATRRNKANKGIIQDTPNHSITFCHSANTLKPPAQLFCITRTRFLCDIGRKPTADYSHIDLAPGDVNRKTCYKRPLLYYSSCFT